MLMHIGGGLHQIDLRVGDGRSRGVEDAAAQVGGDLREAGGRGGEQQDGNDAENLHADIPRDIGLLCRSQTAFKCPGQDELTRALKSARMRVGA